MLGRKIQQLRKEKGMSQEELAAQLTISRQAVSKWELGESMPDTENVVQISKLFGVTTDYLLHDDYEEQAEKSVNENADASLSDDDANNAIEPDKPRKMKKGLKIALLVMIPICVIFLAIVAFVLMFMVRTSYKEITIHPESAPVAYAILQENNFRIRVEGTNILVPASDIDEARKILRENGISPISFHDPSHPQIVQEIQLAEDLRTMIIQAPNVVNALVAISEGSVSILLQVENVDKLPDEAIAKIIEIVKNTVPETYTEINISDSNFNSYEID